MKKQKPLLQRIAQYLALMSQRAREGHLSVSKQLAEMTGLALLTGNGPGYYLTAGFYQRNISWRDKTMHLGSGAYRDRLSVLNPVSLRIFTQNKLVEKSLLTTLGFPTPRFVGVLHASLGRTASGRELRDPAQFAALIQAYRERTLVFKLLHGWAGQGFIAARVEDLNGVPHLKSLRSESNSTPIPVDAFYRTLLAEQGSAGRLIEEYFYQHPDLASFNPSSVNTCRIWVAKEKGGRGRVVLAYLRIGRGGSLVDNQSAGGIVAAIDLETGVTAAAIDGLPQRVSFKCHPDHGAPILGRSIPFWNEAKALAENCVTAFPGLQFAGTDVAIGANGPVIIELNASPDREGAAFVGIPSSLIVPQQRRH